MQIEADREYQTRDGHAARITAVRPGSINRYFGYITRGPFAGELCVWRAGGRALSFDDKSPQDLVATVN